MTLSDLLKERVFENDIIEVKQKLDRNDPESWLKTVVGFANYKGGTFYIGAEDGNFKLIGFDSYSADKERNYFYNLVNTYVNPNLDIKSTLIPYTVNDKDLFILKITIGESIIKPVALQYKSGATFYMRRDGFTNNATIDEIKNMVLSCSSIQFDMIDSNKIYDKSKFTKLFQFYKEKTSSTLTDKILASIGFFNVDHRLKNGACLFLDDCSSSKTQLFCSIFSGINKGSERTITLQKYKGNLIDLIGYAKEFVESRMNRSFIKLPDRRIDIEAFPYRALFEGIINAIAHRDYYLDGTQIQIDMFQDRLEITSPGSFYLSNFNGTVYDLSKLISKRRNELICNILVRCKVMEAAGTGFDKIIEDYKDADLRHKPFARLDSDKFTLVLPDLTYEPGIENNSVNITYDKVSPSSKYDEQILAFCYLKEKSVLEIAEHIQVSNSTYLRDVILGNLCKNSLLTKSNRDNRSYYFTNGDKVRLL